MKKDSRENVMLNTFGTFVHEYKKHCLILGTTVHHCFEIQ